MFDRSAGILLHPTSLPGPYGIGDLGDAADAWLDWLVSAGCRTWQILPLGPTGYADSPYQCLSSFSLNPLLVDPDGLVADGLLASEERPHRRPSNGAVDFEAVRTEKAAMLETAWSRFGPDHPRWSDYATYRTAEAAWLDDDALFLALKADHRLAPWTEWPAPLRDRDPAALASATGRLEHQIGLHAFTQWIVADQWGRLRRRAAELGVTIVGDIPLYVAHDSSDVWVDRHLFDLTADGAPATVGGVPPDYFSDTGQRWGNPTYDWAAHAADGFTWWARRLAATARHVDVVRIDHFRGIADYWAIPGSSPTAAVGTWQRGPGMALFDALRAQLGELKLIAEDLGDLSDAADRLLAALPFPGMKILQFMFDDREEAAAFSLADIPDDVVVYTATHDNDTTQGWFAGLEPNVQDKVLATFSATPTTVAHRMIETAWESKACLAVAPMQDVLALGTEARMNEPGTTDGNWRWRLPDGAAGESEAAWLRRLAGTTGRS